MLTAVFLSVTGLFAALGIVFACGKGSGLIAGYNTASAEEKAKYNEKNLCRAMSVLMFALAACFLLAAFSALFNIKPLFWISQALFALAIAAGLVYLNTSKRIKSK